MVGCGAVSQIQSTTQSFTAAHMIPWFAFTMQLATFLRRTSTRRISKIDCACRAAELVAGFMNYRTLTVAVALIVVPFASAESEAYDTVFYKGKTSRLRIVFEFDHGHVEASNVRIIESASGKTTKFYLSGRDEQMGTGKMRFAPVKGARKEVLLEMDPFGDPLSTIKGSYTAAGKTVPFTLTKRKKH